jgi:hypothetical protein
MAAVVKSATPASWLFKDERQSIKSLLLGSFVVEKTGRLPLLTVLHKLILLYRRINILNNQNPGSAP